MKRGAVRLAALVLASLGVSLAPPASFAQEDKENRDFLFARALIDRGFGIVAEGVIERALSAPGTSEKDKERFQVLKLMLSLRTASRSSAGQRLDAFKDVFAALDLVVEKDGKVKAEGQAASDLGEFLLEGSTIVAEEARSQETPDKAADLKKRAVGMVDAAEKLFQSRLDAAQAKGSASQAKADGGEAETDEDGSARVSRDEMEAAYNLSRARMQRGKVLETKDEKERAFKEAIRNLEDFQATYADTLLVYQAAILAGQCWNEMENYGKAMEAFQGAVELIEQFRGDQGEIVVDNPVAADIIQRALFLRAQAANKAQKYPVARLTVKRAFEIFPEIRRRPIGLVLRLEEGEALAKLNKPEEARKAFEEVERDNADGPWGAEARQRLGGLAPLIDIKGGERDLAPMINGFLDSGRYTDAIQTCRQLLIRFDALPDADRANVVPAVLIWLGKVYSLKEVKRYQEAAIVFEELVDRYPTHKIAPEAAFQAVRTRLLANVGAPSKFDQDRYEEDLKRLMEKYKDSEQAGRGKFIEADAAFEMGDYEKAAKIYLSVPKSVGQFRDNALFQAGLCYWYLAVRSPTISKAKPYYEQAEKVFKECEGLAGLNEPGLDTDRIQNRTKLRASARVKLADIYCSFSLKRYKEALAVIEACDKEDKPIPEDAAVLLLSRVRTHAALGNFPKAEEALQLLKQKEPSFKIIPQLCRELAGAYDRSAAEARKKGAEGEKEYRALISKSLEYYAEWFDESNRLKVQVSQSLLVGTKERPGIAYRAHAIALEVTGLPAGKDTFTDCLGRTDIPKADWERAVKFLEAAKPPRSDDWLPPANIGRAYGFLGDWPKARAALEDSLVWGGLLKATGEPKPAPQSAALEKAQDLLDIFVDLGFAELIPAKKGGLARAQSIFDTAFKLAQRDTCSWWKCRYGFICAEVKEGNYDRAQSFLNIIQQADEWSKGDRCGLKEQFDSLEKEIKTRMPASSADASSGPK